MGNLCVRPQCFEAGRAVVQLATVAQAAFALALIPSVAAAAGPPLSGALDPLKFSISVFASGLSYPTGMALLPDGSLLVGTTANQQNLFLTPSGQLLRVVDDDRNGISERQSFYGQPLPGAITDVVTGGGFVAVLSSGLPLSNSTRAPKISFLSADDPDLLLGALGLPFPEQGWEHTSFTLQTRPSPLDSSLTELYFGVGSRFNNQSTPSTDKVALKGNGLTFTDAELLPDSIYKVDVSGNKDTGLTVSSPRQIATGLRNPTGITFNAFGDLLITDNGIDGNPIPTEPVSVDELNIVTAEQLRSGKVVDFGFAETYTQPDGTIVENRPGTQPPLLSFTPLGPQRSQGAVEIVPVPASFPLPAPGLALVSFFGNSQGGSNNNFNSLALVNPASGSYENVIPPGFLGRPYGLLASDRSVYLSDLSFNGELSGSNSPRQGVIYAITPVNTVPAPLPVLAVGAAFAWSRALRRRIRTANGAGSQNLRSSRRGSRWVPPRL